MRDTQEEATETTSVLRLTEPPEPGQETASSLAVIPKSPLSHPALESLLQLRESGERPRARLGFDQFAKTLENQPTENTPEAEALWLEATRLSFETALQSEQFDLAVNTLRQRFARFQQPVWTGLKTATDRFYHDMIGLSIATGLEEQAFELYESARAHIRVTADLRVKLLEIAARLDRVDPATARLCIEELTSESSRDSEQSSRLLGILRRAICVTPVAPRLELLAEFRSLNQQVQEAAPQTWAIGHLAMADWRLGRAKDALQWCERLRKNTKDPAETDLLIGAVGYLLQDWSLARAKFELALSKPAPEHSALANFLQQLERLNGALERRGRGQTLAAFQEEITLGLSGVRGTQPSDEWQLDAPWLIGSALCVLEQVDEALKCFEHAPLKLARWRTLSTAWELLRSQRSPAELEAWTRTVSEVQPVQAQLLSAWQATLELRFDDARRLMAGLREVHGDMLQSDTELGAAVSCLTAELNATSAEATAELPEKVPHAFHEWHDQLQIRRHVERGERDAARKLLDKTSQHTAGAGRQRITAVVATLDKAHHAVATSSFQKLASIPEPELIDKLHWALWLVHENRFSDAVPLLASVHGRLPHCVECQLALIECALRLDRADEARERLMEISQLKVWRNKSRAAWFRPWQHLVSKSDAVDRAEMAAPRLADMLHAVALQLRAGLPDLVLETLEQIEQVLGDQRESLAPAIGAGFAQVASFEAQRGNWESACRSHQAATARGVREPRFAEDVARGHEEVENAPDEVLEVLFTWATEFGGEEELYLQTITGHVFSRLIQLDSTTAPASDLEFQHRWKWTARFAQAKPDWDGPKRSLMRGYARQRDDAAVVRTALSLRQPTGADQRLLARALWNQGQFQEAAEAFAAGGERAWGGCARAAELLRQMAELEHWLPEDVAAPVLAELTTREDGAELPPQLPLWTGALLVACGRGGEALPYLQAAVTSDADEQAGHRVLWGLASLQARELAFAENLWGPPAKLDEVLASPNKLMDWNRREAGLWLLVQLQCAGDRRLPQLGQLLQQFRRLGETSEPFRLAQAQLALRIGDVKAVEDAKPLDGVDPFAPRDVLAAPLRCLLRAERDFVRSRWNMCRGDFAAAESAFQQATAELLWPSRSQYWRAMCLIRLDQKSLAETTLTQLRKSVPDDPAIPAQLALLKIADDDLSAAERLVQEALTLEATHGFALLALAQVRERLGDSAAAQVSLRQLLDLPDGQISRHVRVAAELALGRFAFDAGDPAEALNRFRAACRLSDNHFAPLRRLGVLLAFRAESAEELREAEELLSQTERMLPQDALVLTALVATADQLGRTDLMAERLERLLAHLQFEQLPAETRRELAILSADTQLRLKRYSAAAAALEQLFSEHPEPAIAERLRRCRLMQAVQVLGQRPLPAEAMQEMFHAAEAVCVGPEPPAVAVLLKAIALLFLGQCDSPEARKQTLNEVKSLSPVDPETRRLAAIARFWLGDTTARADLADLFAKPETALLARLVETVASSLQKKPAALKEEARRIVDSNGAEPMGAFDSEDVVVLGALADAASKVEQAAALLKHWHATGHGSERTRSLLSKLLSKQAVRSLKMRKFGQTRTLLREALAAAGVEHEEA